VAILSTIARKAHPATGKRQIAGGVTEPSGDGATHAYLSKGHDRPVGAGMSLALEGRVVGNSPSGGCRGDREKCKGRDGHTPGGRRVPLLAASCCQI